MEENKKSKGLAWLIIILIVLVLGIVGYIIYDNFLKVDKTITKEENSANISYKEDKIKENFLKDIELVKLGKGTDAQRYLLCDVEDCENIDIFNVDSVEFFEKDIDNKEIYKIKLSWKCKDSLGCFYNEKDTYNTKTGLIEVETFYKVNSKYKIIEYMGNYHNIYREEANNIVFDFQEFQKDNAINNFHDLTTSYERQEIDVTINNINIKDKNYSLKIINYPTLPGAAMPGVEMYLNEKKIYPKSQYFEDLENIIVFKNQYLILHYDLDIYVFDENGMEIPFVEEIIAWQLNIDNENKILIGGYGYEDEGCPDNVYELKIENNIASYNLIKKGISTGCN